MPLTPSLAALAERYLTAAQSPSCVRFGDRKIFLASIPGVDLRDAACRAELDQLRRAELLRFARADLVAAMDPAMVAASEWRLDGTEYHFLVIEPGSTAAERAARYADIAATSYPVVTRPAGVSPSGRTMRAAIARLAGGAS